VNTRNIYDWSIAVKGATFMIIETIRDQLKQLRLPTASRELESIVSSQKKSLDIKWLSLLLETELNARKDNAVERRIKRGGFPERRTFEQFNWEFNKKLPREKIEDLATLKFIERNEIGLFLGSPGTGKTHCAIAIGLKAAEAGYSVFCTSVKRLDLKVKKSRERETLWIFCSSKS
jgi:DNA replication protein DnaC